MNGKRNVFTGFLKGNIAKTLRLNTSLTLRSIDHLRLLSSSLTAISPNFRLICCRIFLETHLNSFAN